MVNRTGFKFEELNVYMEALEFVDFIYALTNRWPKDELFGLINQARRASVSVVLNLAEGSSRSRKDFRHFLDLSRGSCYECFAILRIALKRKYISEVEFDKGYEFCNKISRMLSALKKSIN